jgi:hypothetical protein
MAIAKIRSEVFYNYKDDQSVVSRARNGVP